MPTPANGYWKKFDFETVLVTLRILRQQDDIRNIPKLSRRAVAYPGIFFGGGSANSIEDRGQRTERTGIWGR